MRNWAVFFCAMTLSWPVAANEIPEAVSRAVAKLVPGLEPNELSSAPVEGLYEASFGTELVYISADGRYMMRGDVVDLKDRTNLTEKKRESVRIGLLKEIPDADMIVYGKDDAKHKIHVFTDIDCPYCVKFHRQIPELVRNDVQVRYLGFPRSGPGTPSFKKYISVWCAEDKSGAMTKAKYGTPPDPKKCDNPVEKQFTLGRYMGVRGTPTMILGDGKKIPGYMPAKKLLQTLNASGG